MQSELVSCLTQSTRERASGAYGTASYFTATVAFDFVPMRVLPTTLFAITTYWMIGLRPGLGHAATFLLLLVMTNLTGAAMNMAIGAYGSVLQTLCCLLTVFTGSAICGAAVPTSGSKSAAV
jgi:hypothetical protein